MSECEAHPAALEQIQRERPWKSIYAHCEVIDVMHAVGQRRDGKATRQEGNPTTGSGQQRMKVQENNASNEESTTAGLLQQQQASSKQHLTG
jgi:hypothetical protein